MIAGLVALLIRGDGLVDALSQPVSYSTLFVLFWASCCPLLCMRLVTA
ncbi:hypothetical protein [Rathayibacter toxicus]|nr:hypothetical protein [Rathayibacter toxicus]QOD10116.1 hypothetical protein BSG36_09380 [Rathayibacter toxicus]